MWRLRLEVNYGQRSDRNNVVLMKRKKDKKTKQSFSYDGNKMIRTAVSRVASVRNQTLFFFLFFCFSFVVAVFFD